TEAANQFVKDIIGPRADSADKTADDSKAGKSSDIVESRDPVKHNIDNINVSTDNAWGLSAIAAAAASAGSDDPDNDGYATFGYDKPDSFAELERARMAAHEAAREDDDSDGDDSDDDGYDDNLNYRSQFEGDIEHLKFLLDTGSITE